MVGKNFISWLYLFGLQLLQTAKSKLKIEEMGTEGTCKEEYFNFKVQKNSGSASRLRW